MPRTRPSLASLLIVPKLRCDNQRYHNQLLVFDALGRRQIRDVLSMSSKEIVYKFVSRDPESRSTPSKLRIKQHWIPKYDWVPSEYGEKGHTRNRCPKRNNPQGGNATGQAYLIREAEKGQGPNVVAGTFLINNRYASVLFDSGSDKSFINTSFSHLIDIKPVRVNTSYEVELADGKIVSTNTVLRGCTLNLINHLFEIDLMPIELGTFDIVIGMDWLVERDAVIVYGKKEVHIPVKNKVLVVKGKEKDIRSECLNKKLFERSSWFGGKGDMTHRPLGTSYGALQPSMLIVSITETRYSKASTMVDTMGMNKDAQVARDPGMYFGGYAAGYGVYPGSNWMKTRPGPPYSQNTDSDVFDFLTDHDLANSAEKL
ncbi:reverse transcriptase domain-containing protein [Tanacetum coccineum]